LGKTESEISSETPLWTLNMEALRMNNWENHVIPVYDPSSGDEGDEDDDNNDTNATSRKRKRKHNDDDNNDTNVTSRKRKRKHKEKEKKKSKRK